VAEVLKPLEVEAAVVVGQRQVREEQRFAALAAEVVQRIGA
jgi:hypothetical protein